MESDKPRVLITGITGFLGSHICLQFLQDGGYQVVGSVRDRKNPKKMQPIKDGFGPLFDNLEIVELELTDEESILRAAKGCQFIVHTASPFPIG